MLIRATIVALAIMASMPGILAAQETRIRTGGSDAVRAADGYKVDVFAQRLGEISDMVRHPDGTLFVADRSAGRLFRIQDRGLDGRADITQPLPQRFDRPSGLAFINETLFVADRSGLWRLRPGGGTPDLVASFANSGSIGEPHPIVALPPGRDAVNGTIRLGQTRADGTTRLIDIDPLSGVATRVEDGPGSVIAFSRSAPVEEGNLPPWPIVRRSDGVWFGATLASARKLTLSARHVWIDRETNRLIIASDEGVARATIGLGGVGAIDTMLLDGFDVRPGRLGGGRPGPVLMDERGLFVADLEGGRVWRIVEAEPVIAVIEPDIDTPEPDVTPSRKTPDELLLRGSGLSQISTLDAAPTPIKPGGSAQPSETPDPS